MEICNNPSYVLNKLELCTQLEFFLLLKPEGLFYQEFLHV